MKKMAELISKEYESRLKDLDDRINLKQKELEETEQKLKDVRNIREKKFYVEKKYNGIKAIVHKKNNDVKIFAEQGNDITFAFPIIVEQAKTLSNTDYIIDCEFVPYSGSTPLGRDIAVQYVSIGDKPPKTLGTDAVFFVSDCIFFGTKITDLPLYERKKIISSFKFTDNIRIGGSIISDSEESMIKSIKMFSSMPGSDGAVIKYFDSKYYFGNSSEWIKYNTLIELNVEILNITELDNSVAKNYQIGIKLEDSSAYSKEYIMDKSGLKFLILGNTVTTGIEANIGDKLKIKVEEILSQVDAENKIRYSIVNPKVDSITLEDSNLPEVLDKYVVRMD